MRMTLRLGCLAVAALLAGCADPGPVPMQNIYSTENPTVVSVKAGTGGFINSVFSRYWQWSQEGRRLVIDGPVVSADAFAAFSYDGEWCYTRRAVARLHAASRFALMTRPIPNHEATEELTALLPPLMAEAFRREPSFRKPEKLTNWDAETLDRLIPERRCI